jgi:hypothetical protein
VNEETHLTSSHRQQLLYCGVSLGRRVLLHDAHERFAPLVGVIYLVLVRASGEFAAAKAQKLELERAHEQQLAAREAERVRRRQRCASRNSLASQSDQDAESEEDDEGTDEVDGAAEMENEASEEPPSELQMWYARGIADEMRAAENEMDETSIPPNEVAQLCLHEASNRPLEADALVVLAMLFCQQSAAAVAAALLKAPPNVVALEAVGPEYSDIQRKQHLENIVSAAESESGQVYFRELLSSFMLPRNVVGVRRTLMMSRATNEVASLKHASVVHEAHSLAMLGTDHCYAQPMEENRQWHFEVVQISALLAGAAMLLRKPDDCPRTSGAFRGRISLPFLELPMPQGRRLHYLSHQNAWVLARHGASGASGVSVLAHGEGLRGLESGLLALLRK